MKTMVTLKKLIGDVEDEILDAEATLIETEGIAVLNNNYDIHPEQSDSDDPTDD